MPDDYGYINARIRAMKSFLLTKEDYHRALSQNTPEEFANFLSGVASYSNDFRYAQCSDIDAALKSNLCRTFRKIVNFSDAEPKELILILLSSWDMYNLKTIIRSIVCPRPKEEALSALVPCARWDMEFLTRLAEARDLKALAGSLCQGVEEPISSALAGVIKNYSSTLPLARLENNLQDAYFKAVCGWLALKNGNCHIVLEYMKAKIDFLNSKRSILASRQSRTQRLSGLERVLKNKLLSYCNKLYTSGDPLSIAIAIGFINFKEDEISNLRLIAKAIKYKLPQGLIKEELAHVL